MCPKGGEAQGGTIEDDKISLTMSTTIMTKLLDKRNKAHADAQEIHKLAIAEDRDLTSDEQEKFDKAFEDVERFDRQLKQQEKLANLEDYSDIDGGQRAAFGGAEVPEKPRSEEEVQRLYAEVLERNMIRAEGRVDRNQFMKLVPKELRVAQNVGTPADGGYLVPEEWQSRIIESMKYYGPMLQAGRIFNTSTGAEMHLPTHDATSEKGAIIGEDIQDTIAKTALSEVKFGSFMYTSKIIPITIELLQDAAYDVVGLVRDTCASRIGRILNEHLTDGVGTTTPFGVATKSTDSAITLTANTITADKLVDLEHTVDILYRQSPSTAFMFHDSTLAAIKKLSYGTSDDRPLWLPSIRVGEPDRILGYRYWVNNDMDDLGTASNKAVLFGDFSKYEIRRVLGMTLRRSDEFYWDARKVAFNMIARFDANLVDTAAIKYMAVEGGGE